MFNMACPIGPYDPYCFERRKCAHFSFCSRYDRKYEPFKDHHFRSCSNWRKGQPRTVPLKTTLVATGYPLENWIIKRCRRIDIKWPGTSKQARDDDEEEDGEECGEDGEEYEEMTEDPLEGNDIGNSNTAMERGTNNASAVFHNRSIESPSFSELHLAGDGACVQDRYLEDNVPKISPQKNNLLRVQSKSFSKQMDLQITAENDDSEEKNRDAEIQVDILERQPQSPEKKLEFSVEPPIPRQRQSALKRIFNISSVIKTGIGSNHETTLVPLQKS
ncbi:hypothetical protein TcWFU_007259 [Taenia crassiceps]|uniref:Uncharacterized protein n=1 Tax=Taenia crassiceps TaxID=6207 RepID=A0ABR4QNI5_9CEST